MIELKAVISCLVFLIVYSIFSRHLPLPYRAASPQRLKTCWFSHGCINKAWNSNENRLWPQYDMVRQATFFLSSMTTWLFIMRGICNLHKQVVQCFLWLWRKLRKVWKNTHHDVAVILACGMHGCFRNRKYLISHLTFPARVLYCMWNVVFSVFL